MYFVRLFHFIIIVVKMGYIDMSKINSNEVAIGIGLFESVIQISRFREWAWVGLLVINSVSIKLVLEEEKVSILTKPHLSKVKVFIYGPFDSSSAVSVWEEVDARTMHEYLISYGNPIPHQIPKKKLLLSENEKAVIWIYLEDNYLNTVTVMVSIEVVSSEEIKDSSH